MEQTIEQGDILRIQNIAFPVLAVSKDFFNTSGEIIGCPILQKSMPSPLHIPVQAKLIQGYVQCEQLRLLDLRARRYQKVDKIGWNERIDISDAIQGIFDYI